jgi:hypothetical protein
VQDSYLQGISQSQIIKNTAKISHNHTPLSRMTVYNLLKKLMAKGEVRKSNGKYFAIDHYIGGWSGTAEHLHSVLTSKILSGSTSVVDPLPSKTYSGNDLISRSIHEFVNTIGAYITYVFIEAMHPSENAVIPSRRNDYALHFIDEFLSPEKMFYQFQQKFNVNKGVRSRYEMDAEDHNRLFDTLVNQHPFIKEIESEYRKHLEEFLVYNTFHTMVHTNCEHKWKEVYLHKLGRHHVCVLCHAIVPIPLKNTRSSHMTTEQFHTYLMDTLAAINKKYRMPQKTK